ncbi:MAG: hypothetical protein A3F91_05300 [Flavobacteria bacterium RIFCSPLOWO2_12_FULL_35_11]|nr:MAG: hypothetical protein A3F91_05300 [Flavobacteria bacterium RIFCSPLOWO2_12_FULL_35_11]
MSIDSENSLFRQFNNNQIPNLIERNQFNKRRRKLFLFSEKVRTKLASYFLEFEDYFIVDSMPIEITNHNRMFLENQEKELKPFFYNCVTSSL